MRAGFPLIVALLATAPARAGADLEFGAAATLEPGQQPALIITPGRTIAVLVVEVTAGGEVYRFDRENLPAGKAVRLSWKRDEAVTEATALISAEYTDGHADQFEVPIQYEYAGKLEVDLSRATADIARRVLTVRVSGRVDSADITAYGAGKAVLDQRTVPIGAGPGEIEVPWTGDPGEVVLLDVSLRRGNAWAGFTYSPWFLDIPHEDLHFETDQAEILSSEVWKLQATLEQLRSVLEKYGSVVPVKLYIAGCTDTVGNPAHNLDLSRRRAKAIATWLRANGYDRPIYYHGFGEGFLAVPTGDEVEEGANRRALYLVGANPPPAGSGVPVVSWTAL